MRARDFAILMASLAVAACQTIAPDGAAPSHPRSSISGAKQGVAIQGYDPVAYWTQGTDVAGSPDLVAEWSGTTWHFATDEHRDLFRQAPERYAPQYGGHCALAVANGYTARGAGDAWTIHAGRLYLNASKAVRARWQRDVPGNIRRADRLWPDLKNELEGG